MHARKQVRVDDVGRRRFDDRIAVVVADVRFFRRQPARTDVGKVGAHRLRGQDRVARGNRAGQRDRSLEHLADFAHQRERRQRARMATSASGHQDQAIDARFQRFLGVADRDDIVQHDAAVRMHGVHHLARRCAQRRNDDRYLVLDADFDVMRQAVVRLVDDLVDGDRADLLARIGRGVVGQFALQVGQPDVEHLGRPGIECRERADDAGLALGCHQRGPAGNEHRRSDDRKGQVLQRGGHRHGSSRWWVEDGPDYSPEKSTTVLDSCL